MPQGVGDVNIEKMPRIEKIPDALKKENRWILWKYETRKDDKKKTKVPCDTRGRKIDATSEKNWLSFSDAINALNAGGVDGIGFALSEKDDITCIDLDNCIENEGMNSEAMEIIKRFHCYTELSPSGKGIHIWCRSGLKKKMGMLRKKNGNYEMYTGKRFITITGWGDGQIETRDSELMWFQCRYMTGRALLDNLLKNENFRALWEGRWEDYTRQGGDKLPSQSEADILLCSMIAKEALKMGITDEDILETLVETMLMMSGLRREKVMSRDDYRKTTVRKAVKNAIEKMNEMEVTGRESTDGVEEDVAGDAFLNRMTDLYLKNMVEFTKQLDNMKIKPGLKTAIKKEVDKRAKERLKNAAKNIEVKVETDPEITEKAWKILKEGDPVEFIANSIEKFAIGSKTAAIKLICCVSVQNVRQSQGLHPKLSGESGEGKSHTLLSFLHHLPEEVVIFGSMSNKAILYHGIQDRSVVVIDDYSEGNDTIDTIIKQTTTVFHKRYKHRTVDEMKPVTIEVGSEIMWAITSVDASEDIQVLNRQIPINVDSSEETTKKVIGHIIERYGEGKEKYEEREEVRISREIFRILRNEGMIDVKIPFYRRIEWLDMSNRRNPEIFLDMVIGLTAMRRYQRERDEDGAYLASIQDFEDARKLLMDKNAEELVRRLTQVERRVLETIMASPVGLSRSEIQERVGISKGRLSQILNGKKGKSGLLLKVRELVEEDVTDTMEAWDSGSSGMRRSLRKKILKLKHGYNPIHNYEAIVRLREEDDGKKENGEARGEIAKDEKEEVVEEEVVEDDKGEMDWGVRGEMDWGVRSGPGSTEEALRNLRKIKWR